MFSFFERLIQPFPLEEPTRPPASLYAFCRHYTRGMELHLLLMSGITALIAVAEVSLFGFLGQLVDWLVSRQPDTLLAQEGGKLALMGLLLLVVLPLLVFLRITSYNVCSTQLLRPEG